VHYVNPLNFSNGKLRRGFTVRCFDRYLLFFLKHSGVGGIDAVDVGINLTDFGIQGRRQCNGGGVGAAPAQGCTVLVLVYALESGDNNNLAFVDLGVRVLIVRPLDFPNTEGIEMFAREVMPRLSNSS